MGQSNTLAGEAAHFIDQILRWLVQHGEDSPPLPEENLQSLAMAASITTREQEAVSYTHLTLPTSDLV